MNTGGTEALIWVSFSSPSPGLQVLNTALFGNNLDSDLLEKITLLGDDEVQRLKGILVVLGNSAWQELVNFLSPSY